jgi:hypothetical protein
MSEGKGTQNEDPKDEPLDDPILELKEMFHQFLATSSEIQLRNRTDIGELKNAILEIKKSNLKSPPREEFIDTPLPDRSRGRRSSMFFGMPHYQSSVLESAADTADKQNMPTKANIQVLQADIVYDKELKISSLEGLQYLSRQLQLLSSKYPGREIKMAHMVSYNLRPHVLASWNSHQYRESVITGAEPNEVMVEDWLSLTNSEVQAILVEAARPRTKELYSKELILFLGKGIPQTPSISTDNFSSTFYAPLMKSLTDLLHLHDLMSEETSNHSANKSKMPVPGYGTRDSPGQIALWLISLGAQKDSILQWLSKDELIKQKSVEQAVKFVRARLMEGRAQSEARQDLDARLTPIRYEDLRYTQGESHARHQVSNTGRQPFVTPRKYDQRPQSNFSSLATSANPPLNASDNAHNEEDLEYEDALILEANEDMPHDHIDALDPEDESLLAINVDQHRSRSAVSATFRGYCSEAFVYGKCARQHSGCTFDHSTAGQERCIQSFSLLAKRELQLHGQLEPWSSPKQEPTSGVKTGNAHGYKHYGLPQVPGAARPSPSSTPTRPYQK